MDYKKAYMEQKHQSLTLEMNLMQMRAGIIEKELSEIKMELQEYADQSEKSDTDKA